MWPARCSPAGAITGPGERLGLDHIGISRVRRKDFMPGRLVPDPLLVNTDALHCHLLDQPPCPGPVNEALVMFGDWFFEGRYEPPPQWGVTRRCP